MDVKELLKELVKECNKRNIKIIDSDELIKEFAKKNIEIVSWQWFKASKYGYETKRYPVNILYELEPQEIAEELERKLRNAFFGD